MPSRRRGIVSSSRPFPQIIAISLSRHRPFHVERPDGLLTSYDDSCTVFCFKSHKLSGCSSEKEYIHISVPLPLFEPLTTSTDSSTPLSISSTDPQALVDPGAKSKKRSRDEILRANRPTRKLVQLDWPIEPLESMWDDPLSRDDLKPLRGWEYEAIGSSIF